MSRYVSIKNVAARLSRNHKNIDFEEDDIAEWCLEVLKKMGSFDSFQLIEGEQYKVQNKKVALPCNMYRLLKVNLGKYNLHFNDNRLAQTDEHKVRYDGNYLRFDNLRDGNFVYLDYIKIEMDEDDYPLILDWQVEPCYWYCLHKLYFEDYLNGKIDQNRYYYIEQKYNDEFLRAKSSMRDVTRNDMDRLTRNKMRMILNPTRMPNRLD